MPRIHTKYLQRFEVVDRRVWDADEEYGDAEEVVEGARAEPGGCSVLNMYESM